MFKSIESLPARMNGLAGIQQLFGCGKTTAQKYKNTWLAPAVSQRGRILIIDTALALELFADQEANKK